jgi:hypothetical protein
MTSSNLERLAATHHLKREAASQEEFAGLLRSGLARLEDAHRPALNIESRFDLAYNAAHALSLAALRWHGYRPDRRYIVFQCLEHTLGLLPEAWRVMDQAHNRRNLAEYEGAIEVDISLLQALLRVTLEVARRVQLLDPIV